jgi:5-methylcytosine-specific restriction endonuclease McrA
VDQAVDHGRGDDVVGEGLSPASERKVGGDHDRGLFVAGGDELEEQVGGILVEGIRRRGSQSAWPSTSRQPGMMTPLNDAEPDGKRCGKCGTEKPTSDFSKARRMADGLQPYCKACMHGHYERDKPRVLAQQRDYYAANRDWVLARQAAYDAANRDRVLAYRKGYRRANAPALAAKTARWREENPDGMRSWREANPGYSRRNHAARKARRLSLPYERVGLAAVLGRSGGWCWMCREPIGDDGVVDHLVPLAADAEDLTRWGIAHPGHVTANLDMACARCNGRKSNRIMPCAIARYLRNAAAPGDVSTCAAPRPAAQRRGGRSSARSVSQQPRHNMLTCDGPGVATAHRGRSATTPSTRIVSR